MKFVSLWCLVQFLAVVWNMNSFASAMTGKSCIIIFHIPNKKVVFEII